MKKFLLVLVMVIVTTMTVKAAEYNKGIGRSDVAVGYRAKDSNWMVRFSTTVPANTSVVIFSTATFNNLLKASGIDYSPGITASTSTTMGGRFYCIFQVVSCTGKTHVDLNTVDISTVTSPYLNAGDWFSPDDPISWQGPIVVMPEAASLITGWAWFEQKR